MRILFYTHSLVSDWNHGNAHFLRGVMRDLLRRGHQVLALEPEDSWSRANLLADQGQGAIDRFAQDFPHLQARRYGPDCEHEAVVETADLVIVHEWTDPELVVRLGRARAAGGRFTLLFHDTHHRAVSASGDIAGLELDGYDGILAFGEALRQRYLRAGWGRAVFTWHEAADDALFQPLPEVEKRGDLIWIGNWGDDERSTELEEFLVRPAEALGLAATVRGVRYPKPALDRLASAGIAYGGWIANADVRRAFAAHRVTVHVPRRPYIRELPGIPTIRMFEALACGIPLVSAPWDDVEGLFRPGQDFLFARDGGEMRHHLRAILDDPAWAQALAASGLQRIADRHTCRHRVDELFQVLRRIGTARVTRQLAVPEPAQ